MKSFIRWTAMLLVGIFLLGACTLTDHRIPTPINNSSQPTEAHKIIAVLALMANVNYNLVTTSQAALKLNTQKINTALTSSADLKAYVGNDWQVVWGPVTSNSLKKKPSGAVSVADSFVTDNTMYVARGINLATGKAMYVVGIAGTNVVSEKGWKLEDFNVFREASWGMPNSGKISAGSQVGLTILSGMKDERTGKTMIEFFDAQPDRNTTEIAFTGHSLGGALSPLMALRFIEYKEKMGYTTPVSIYPIAGPTSGDTEFAAYAAQKFGDGYHSVINAYDIVPNSWQKDMFAKIPTLYSKSPPFNPGGKAGFELPWNYRQLYNTVKVLIDLKRYKRIAVDKEYVFIGKPNTYPDQSGNFISEARYQHVQAYFVDGFQFPQPVVDVIKLFAK